MKFLHLSDLHIGKRVNEFSMLEDQEYILSKIINIVDEEKPDGVFISGDVYDKSVPSAEAVTLFDDFLVRLAKRELKIFIISGNHDSVERLAFGAQIMNKSGVFIAPVYTKNILPIVLSNNTTDICIYMLPFVKPAHVRAEFAEAEINSYTDALSCALNNLCVNKSKVNILLTHQFVTGAQTSDSEDITVGGTDNVLASVFDDFDYVALGHIHKPQSVTLPTIRYCGTPLKYSFSEVNHTKSVTVINVANKNNIEIKTIDLIPKRDMVEIKGEYMLLSSKSYYSNLNLDNYYHITLTDEENVPDALNKLRVIYKNIMKLDYDNKRTQQSYTISGVKDIEDKTPLALLSEFYQLQNNQPISKEQEEFVSKLIKKIWEGEK